VFGAIDIPLSRSGNGTGQFRRSWQRFYKVFSLFVSLGSVPLTPTGLHYEVNSELTHCESRNPEDS
jgi:hypothetical protein